MDWRDEMEAWSRREDQWDAAIGLVVRAAVMVEQSMISLCLSVVDTVPSVTWPNSGPPPRVVRRMIRDGAANSTDLDHLTAKRLAWVVEESARLLDKRNTVIHGSWGIGESHEHRFNARPRKNHAMPELSKWTRDELLDLADELCTLSWRIRAVSYVVGVPNRRWDAWDHPTGISRRSTPPDLPPPPL